MISRGIRGASPPRDCIDIVSELEDMKDSISGARRHRERKSARLREQSFFNSSHVISNDSPG